MSEEADILFQFIKNLDPEKPKRKLEKLSTGDIAIDSAVDKIVESIFSPEILISLTTGYNAEEVINFFHNELVRKVGKNNEIKPEDIRKVYEITYDTFWRKL